MFQPRAEWSRLAGSLDAGRFQRLKKVKLFSRAATFSHLRAVTKADGKEVANVLTQDSQFSLTLDKVAAGAVVARTVTARNASGESPAGNAVEIAVP